MNDVASSREALDLLRANSQLVRQIGEIYDQVTAIEAQHGLTMTSTYSNISHEFRLITPLDGDVVKKRALNARLRKELVEHRAYLVKLKAEVRRSTSPRTP